MLTQYQDLKEFNAHEHRMMIPNRITTPSEPTPMLTPADILKRLMGIQQGLFEEHKVSYQPIQDLMVEIVDAFIGDEE